MSFQDKTIQCTDCGVDFAFTAEEQELFQTRGYTNEPKRCPSCRQARKAERNGNRGNNYGLLPYAQSAAKTPKCLSSLPMAGRSIVAIATIRSD